jgi:hypothetical protein
LRATPRASRRTAARAGRSSERRNVIRRGETTMTRTTRRARDDAFADAGGFDQQLYDALRASPWWMISIGAHVLLFVVSTMLATEEVALAEATTVVKTTVPPTDDPLPQEEPKPIDDEPIDQVRPEELVPATPTTIEEIPIAEHDETDNNLEFDEALGVDGQGMSYLGGPATNDVVGIGPGAGNPFGRGRGGDENSRRRPGGHGGAEGEAAVLDALRWLAAHQSPDGGWEGAGFHLWCDGRRVSGPGPDGLGKAGHDPGLTGLALLAFLGAGYTNRGDHPFAKTVASGLRYLKNVQDPEGCFGPRANQHYVYNHAIAALAMVEAYGMTGSAIYKGPAQKALDFIAIARNPYFAWRYGIKPGDNDTSVTGWMMMALKSAKLINAAEKRAGRPEPLSFDEESFDGIRTWIDKVTDEQGRVGYLTRGSGPARTPDMVDRFPGELSESMTGVGVLARIFLGEDPKRSDAVQKGAARCLERLPRWDPSAGTIDMYYWYYATLAMFQVGGDAWKRWNAAIKTAVVDTQRRDGDYCGAKGSWDPLDPWGPDGGRVYATAVLAMCLEAHYRYDRLFTGSQRD